MDGMLRRVEEENVRWRGEVERMGKEMEGMVGEMEGMVRG